MQFVETKTLIIVIILFLPKITLQQQNNERIVNSVYSPFYLNVFEYSQQQGSPLKIKVSQESEQVFVASGYGGIIILSENGSQILLQQKLPDQYINSFDISKNGRILVIGQKTLFSVYKYYQIIDNSTSTQPFILINQVQLTTEIFDIIYSESKNIIIAAGLSGIIVVYDTFNLTIIREIARYDTKSPQITSIYFSVDEKWIYMSCDIVGVIVLQINVERVSNQIKCQLILAAQGKGYRKSWQVIATNDNEYIYEIENWFGIYYAHNIQTLSSNPQDFPLTLEFKAYWPLKNINPVCNVLLLSQDNNLLFVGVRSIGILIFDISQRENIQFYQHIQIDGLATSAALSKNEKYLYYSNSLSVFTFQNSIPNLQNNYPNTFNVQQSLLTEMQGIYKWRCYVDQSNQYFIGAFDYAGLFIIPFYNDPLRLNPSKQTFLNIETDSIVVTKNNEYLLIPSLYSQNLINIFRIAPTKDDPDISLIKPKQVTTYNITTVQMAEQLIFSKDHKYAIQTYQTGMLFLNVTDILNIKTLYYWPNPSSMIGETGGGAITDDNNWVLGTIRNYGLFVLDARNKTNLILVDFMETLGGESIALSQINSTIAYLMDGARGFAILDLSHLPKLVIISRVALPGWTQFGIPIQNDKFILVCQQDAGMLTLIDIQDKQNPIILSTYKKGKQFAISICTTNDEKYVFITTPQGIISLPLYSKVLIHTEVSELVFSQYTGSKTVKRFELDLQQNKQPSNAEYVFKVGQIIQLNFVILYPEDEDMNIKSIKVYNSDQIQDIPFYMKYDSSSYTLVINVDKLALGDKRDSNNLNIILIKTALPLSANSFIYDKNDESDLGVTNEQQGAEILQYLINRNYLDSKKTIQEYIDPTIVFKFDEFFTLQFKNYISKSITNFDLYFQQVESKIRLTLMKSSFINPFKFFVKTSLFLNFYNPQEYISSPQYELISVYLQVTQGGKFVQREYPGVISSTSESGDQIKIEGSLVNVNRVLEQKIIFSNYENNSKKQLSNLVVTITIIDDINYPLIIKKQINECHFLIQKQQLVVHLPLQQQIDKQFQDSIAYIETDISIQFSQQSFFVADSTNIKYKIQVQSRGGGDNSSSSSGDGYYNLSPDFWLQSQGDQQLNYYGKILSRQFKEVFRFKVIADDGYTKVEDFFELKAYGVPFLYLVNLLLKILGPLIAIFQIIYKRSIFFNMVYRRSVRFQDETAYVGEYYNKKIIVLGKVLSDAQQIVSTLIQKTNQGNNQLKIKVTKLQQHNVENQGEENSQNSTYITNLQSQFMNQQSKISVIKKENLVKQNGDSSCGEQNINFTMLSTQNFNSLKRLPQISFQKQVFSRKVQKRLSIKQPHQISTNSEREFLKKSGCICMQNVIQAILKHNLTFGFNSPLKGSCDYTDDLKNTDSRIFRAVKSFIARHFLQLDKKSHQVYNHIKMYSIKHLKKPKKEWYKSFVTTHYNEDYHQDQTLVIFPQMDLDYRNIILVLINLGVLDSFSKNISSFEELYTVLMKKNAGINLYIIREVLFADTLGFTSYNPSCFKVAQGQSIHLHPYQIKSIQAYKQIQFNKFYRPILSFFNLEFKKYGVSKNMRLPTWLSLDQKHGVILFKGTPSNLDIEEFLIRIYDTGDFVVESFYLKVIPNPNKQDYNTQVSIPDEDNNIVNNIQQCENNSFLPSSPIRIRKEISINQDEID